MDCASIRNLLIEYREKELHGRREAAVESHLRLCEGCRRELRSLDELVSAIAEIPAVDPWPGFARRLRSRFEEETARRRGMCLGGLGFTYRWVGGGVVLFFAGALALGLFLRPHEITTSHRKTDVSVAASGEVSAGQLGEREMRQIMGLWSGSTSAWDDVVHMPDGTLAAFVIRTFESTPEEAVSLWERDLAGVSGLERVVELSGAPDAQVERVLDQVRR